METIMCKAPFLCAALFSAAAMSAAALAQPLRTSPGTYSTKGNVTYGPGRDQFEATYGHQTIVRGPKGHARVYSTYGYRTYGPHAGLSSYTKGTTTYETNGTTAETFGNQTVFRHSNGRTTICYADGNLSYCN
jgi:prepilin-type processing-associated H-X9-DG protein